ncbi:MAG: hypothetical protein ACRCU2_10040 [Planktothrix sp.]
MGFVSQLNLLDLLFFFTEVRLAISRTVATRDCIDATIARSGVSFHHASSA